MHFLQVIAPVDSAWVGSKLALEGYVPSGYIEAAKTPLYMSIIVIALLVLFIVFYRRIITALLSSAVVLVKEKGFHLFEDKYVVSSVYLAFLWSFVLIPALFSGDNVIVERFFYLMALFSGYLFFRWSCVRIIGWITGKHWAMVTVEKIGMSAVECFTVLFLLYSLLHFIFPSISESATYIYLSITGGATLLLYIIRGFQIIISSGFSLFFWILYLCALELMPIGIVVKMALQ